MVIRDALGRIGYRKGKFIVEYSSSGWEILSCIGFGYGKYPAIDELWNQVKPFDSFIKAVRYLKEHYAELI